MKCGAAKAVSGAFTVGSDIEKCISCYTTAKFTRSLIRIAGKPELQPTRPLYVRFKLLPVPQQPSGCQELID
jgi:hypothetical protein